MTQIFIFGASITYGVGAQECGWADLIKRKLHNKMYGENGIGEAYEIYNFGKPGATSDFVLETVDHQIDHYKNDNKTIIILSIGLNNARAKGAAENYVCSLSDYKNQMEEIIAKMQSKVDHVLCLGFIPVDESKTLPMKGKTTYFENKRIQAFNNAFKEICKAHAIAFVDNVIEPEAWIKEHLFQDGLHPNQKGHQLLFEHIYPELEKLL